MILTEEITETCIPGSANACWIYGYFLIYLDKHYGITVHILSYSVDFQSLTQGEGLSVPSTTQGTQTMSGKQTGTYDSAGIL